MKTIHEIRPILDHYDGIMDGHALVYSGCVGDIEYTVEPLKLTGSMAEFGTKITESLSHPAQVLVVNSIQDILEVLGGQTLDCISPENTCSNVDKGMIGVVFGVNIISLQYKTPGSEQPQQFHKFTGGVNAYIITHT